jgi:hypothetical protein
MGAVHIVTGLGGRGTLAGVVSFEDDGEVEDIAAEREVEMFDGPLLQGGGLERGKAVDREGNG